MGAASVCCKQYKKDGWTGWGPGTWLPNSSDLHPIENLWDILQCKVRKRKPKPVKKTGANKCIGRGMGLIGYLRGSETD